MNRFSKLLPGIVALVIVFCVTGLACACPSCKDGLEQGQSNQIQAYFWSILFMMSMPFVIFTSMSAYFYYEVCRARALKVAEANSPVLAGDL